MRICPEIPGHHSAQTQGGQGQMLTALGLHYSYNITLDSYITFAYLPPLRKSKVQRKKNAQYRMMKSIDSEYYKYPCIQMHICVRTFNALFSPGHRWLTSSIVLSKDLWSIVYRVQGTQSQELLFFTQRMWSDSTEVRQPGRLWGGQTSWKLQ